MLVLVLRLQSNLHVFLSRLSCSPAVSTYVPQSQSQRNLFEPAYREAAVVEHARQHTVQMLANAVAAVAPCRHASTFIRWADLDGSGAVSLEEFQTWWTRKQLGRMDPEAPIQSDVDTAIEQAAVLWPNFADEDGLMDEDSLGRFLNSFAVAMEWTQDYDKQRGCATFTNKVTQETTMHQPDILATIDRFLEHHDLVPDPGGTTGRGKSGRQMLSSHEQRQQAVVSCDDGTIDVITYTRPTCLCLSAWVTPHISADVHSSALLV